MLIRLKDGQEKTIELTRIHMEEDSGKSTHDLDPLHTLIDLNRAGVPLLEIVTEPVIKSSEEAYQYVTEIRKLLRYLDICDGNMEKVVCGVMSMFQLCLKEVMNLANVLKLKI